MRFRHAKRALQDKDKTIQIDEKKSDFSLLEYFKLTKKKEHTFHLPLQKAFN